MACAGMAALARSARQQGRGRLLAWRAALAEAQPQALQGCDLEQQQQPAATASLQWRGMRALAQAPPLDAAPRSSLAPAAGGGALQWQPPPPPQQQVQQVQAWALLGRRGYAIGFTRFQKRRHVGPERNLPERNEEIKAAEVRVLYPDDRPSDVKPLRVAIREAKAEGLDVVMVTPKADPPVVRLTEWSKVIYDTQKKEKAALKQRLAQQRAAEPKEVRIGCQIAEHDLAVKMAQARRFLEEGSLLRLVVTFKGGGQIALGRDVTLYLIGQLADLCKVKDEKHLQRPMRGHWAVLLAPQAALPADGAKPPPAGNPKQQQQQQQQGQGQQQAAGAAMVDGEAAAAVTAPA